MSDSSDPGDEIWRGDLFDRRREAELIIGYIESIYSRQTLHAEAHAFTIALDAGYGMGKTFFLRRLSQTLALNHPVAFVDAWADDLADEPLVAIAATLKAALGSEIRRPAIKKHWNRFVGTAGKVARIAGVGVATRAAGLIITHSGAEAIAGLITNPSEHLQEDIHETTASAVDSVSTEGRAAINSTDLMARRIADFEVGKQAVSDLKIHLSELISGLNTSGRIPPIIIVIDELDRCRPTYAVKLLEEVKHLFDVPGIVFIFGLHGDQLAKSVAGAYGPQFDGASYLRRFFQRKISIIEPRLDPLVQELMGATGLGDGKFSTPSARNGRSRGHFAPHEFVSEYMRVYGLTPRDAPHLVDLIQTASALSGSHELELPYFLPLAIGHLQGGRPGSLPEPIHASDWLLMTNHRVNNSTTIPTMAESFYSIIKHSYRDLENIYNNSDGEEYIISSVYDAATRRSADRPSLADYPRLLLTASRFKNPQL